MFADAVVLFMQKTKRGSWDPIGSGTLVFYEGWLYIVSAAHVFEDLARGEVFLAAADKIFSLKRVPALLSSTEAFAKSRAADPVDLGVMWVSEDILDQINGKVKIITRDSIEDEKKAQHIIAYQAVGYPVSKNRKQAEKAAAKNALFTPELALVSGANVTERLKRAAKYSPILHIAMDFTKVGNVDDDMMPADIPVPYGMSGGLLQGCFDYLPHSNGRYPTCASAILIEHIKAVDALIGVRFSFVYAWLDQIAPHLKRLRS
ncbi:hypothetical protein [Massilia phyllosphaerae]|uniref:hypothetical protein n=1 Tax=Massilia phyllosphaerae TaxID=3106034 RepID=UPI002B1CD9FD|nr:hypothetical protein [Massilia sp. SGZ-792]